VQAVVSHFGQVTDGRSADSIQCKLCSRRSRTYCLAFDLVEGAAVEELRGDPAVGGSAQQRHAGRAEEVVLLKHNGVAFRSHLPRLELAVIGRLAVSFRGQPLMTDDVDLVFQAETDVLGEDFQQ
jgi:hypothetical protein